MRRRRWRRWPTGWPRTRRCPRRSRRRVSSRSGGRSICRRSAAPQRRPSRRPTSPPWEGKRSSTRHPPSTLPRQELRVSLKWERTLNGRRGAAPPRNVSRSKPQERRTNGIQPAVSPLLGARRSAADPAFERLYRQHVHAVYRYALAVLQNEADAEDVAQTTFLNAYRAIQRGERPHTPHNWLIKIAHNVCRERFRASSRRPREVELDDSLAPAALADADVPTAIEIRRALGVLAFNQRAALVMRELEGRSYAEIAQVLDVSVSAVETLMFRARRALREQLEGGLTCDEAEEALERLQSRELTSAERGSLRAHLRECKACA